MEKPEVLQFQFAEQTVPVPHHGAVIATDLKARPVDVHLKHQLSYLLNNIFQDQVFQNFPLGALHVCLEDINLQQKDHYYVKMRNLAGTVTSEARVDHFSIHIVIHLVNQKVSEDKHRQYTVLHAWLFTAFFLLPPTHGQKAAYYKLLL